MPPSGFGDIVSFGLIFFFHFHLVFRYGLSHCTLFLQFQLSDEAVDGVAAAAVGWSKYESELRTSSRAFMFCHPACIFMFNTHGRWELKRKQRAQLVANWRTQRQRETEKAREIEREKFYLEYFLCPVALAACIASGYSISSCMIIL